MTSYNTTYERGDLSVDEDNEMGKGKVTCHDLHLQLQQKLPPPESVTAFSTSDVIETDLDVCSRSIE